ncbi:MAG: hypothetical protein QM652_12510 [Legionella sp.]|uniref:hypothetical protein n=1 Tax=Legionella sp. TaxID=459 RepID=UPI0039E33712
MSTASLPLIDPQLFSHPPKVNSELNAWIDSAIRAKKDEMRFDPPSREDANLNSPINISRFGFKNPNDLKNFLLSPAGDTVKAEIGAQQAQEEALKENLRFEQQEQAKIHSLIKIHLLLWLMAKDAHAESVLRELTQAQNMKILEQEKTAAKAEHHEQNIPDINKELQKALAHYNEAIHLCQMQHATLLENEKNIENQIITLAQQKTNFENKSEEYLTGLANFEKDAKKYEQANDTELDQFIQKMTGEINEQTDLIMELLNKENSTPEDEQLARELLHKQNALNLQLASLHDLHSLRNQEKLFFDEKGEPVAQQQKAAYVINNTHKISAKEGKLYLLKDIEDINKISDERLREAGAEFEHRQQEIMSVKKAVEQSLKLEKSFLNFDERLMKAQNKQRKNAKAKTQLENQIKAMQSIRETLSTEIEKNASQDRTKTSPVLQPALAPEPKMSIIFAMKFLTPFLKEPEISTDQLMHKFDKYAVKEKINLKDSEKTKDLLKRIINQLTFGHIPSFAPLPHAIMQSLLQNMDRFGGQDSYQVSAEISPLQLTLGQASMPGSPLQAPTDSPTTKPKVEDTLEQEKIFHPTPFSTNPYK